MGEDPLLEGGSAPTPSPVWTLSVKEQVLLALMRIEGPVGGEPERAAAGRKPAKDGKQGMYRRNEENV